MRDFHLLPIMYKRHASDMLRLRFRMKTEEVRHHLKTGRHVKKVEKNGNIGIIESNIGGSKISVRLHGQRRDYLDNNG